MMLPSALLRNRRYTGFEVWGTFKKSEELLDPDDPSWGNRTRLVRSSEPPVQSRSPAHEPLVSAEEWIQVQRLLSARSAGGPSAMASAPRKGKRTTARSYAFSGLIFCAHCGKKMWASPYNASGNPDPLAPRFVRYRCRARDLVEGSPFADTHPSDVTVTQVELLDGVSAWLGGVFAPENLETTIVAMVQSADVTDLADIRRAQEEQRLADAQTRLSNLVRAIESGIDPILLAPKVAATQDEVAAISSGLVALTPSRVGHSATSLREVLASLSNRLTDVFGHRADPARLNAFFAEIGLRVEFDSVARTAQVTASVAQSPRLTTRMHFTTAIA